MAVAVEYGRLKASGRFGSPHDYENEAAKEALFAAIHKASSREIRVMLCTDLRRRLAKGDAGAQPSASTADVDRHAMRIGGSLPERQVSGPWQHTLPNGISIERKQPCFL